jgi:hypothetical protein
MKKGNFPLANVCVRARLMVFQPDFHGHVDIHPPVPDRNRSFILLKPTFFSLEPVRPQ